jgi:dUTPase
LTIIDLGHRLTQNKEDFSKLIKSSDSLIYVEGKVLLDDSPASLDLAIGDYWYSCSENAYYEIPNGGLTLKPGISIVLSTEQKIGMPSNAFGLVTGKGSYIFQGILIPPSKIDPGFFGELRVGLYNSGRENVVFRKGEAFCSCCFFQIESSFDVLPRTYAHIPKRKFTILSRTRRAMLFYRANWGWIITILIALIALLISAYGIFFK